MKHAVRIALGFVTALAVTWAGAGVPADAALGPHSGDSHRRRLAHDGSGHVLVALGRLDRQLAGALRNRLSPLADRDRTALLTHVSADLSRVESAATTYSIAPTGRHLRAARKLLRTYHPERYAAAATILQRTGRTEAAIAALRPRALVGSSDATDLVAAQALVADVRGHRFTARTTRADLRKARGELAGARALVARARSSLALAVALALG